LINFLNRESVTIAFLFTALMLLIGGAAPSMFHNALVVAGLALAWIAIVMTSVNRL
jgi:hypothetical protein